MRVMGYPEDALGSGEAVIIHTRTHWKVLLGAIFWIVLGIVGVVLLLTLLPGEQQVLGWVGIVAIGIALLWFALWPLVRWLSSSYTVTDQRIMERTGVLRQSGRNIPLQRVSGVSYEKDVIDRALGCGTLMIQSSAEAHEVVFRDVPQVENVQRVVTDLITR
jgi:uncharacterized membrane protein YdbT with pleckstrin-like domain